MPPATTPPVSPSPRPSSVPSPLWSASPHKPAMSADDSHQHREGDDWEVVTRQLDDRADSPLVPSSEDGDAAATELDIWQKAHQVSSHPSRILMWSTTTCLNLLKWLQACRVGLPSIVCRLKCSCQV